MKQFEYVIKDPDGIYSEPAVLLGKKTKEFAGTFVTISKDGMAVPATKLMALIALEAKCGETITVKVEGGDEDAAVSSLEEFLNENL